MVPIWSLPRHNEKLLLLVRFNDVSDDIVAVLKIDSQHLASLALALDWLGQF